MKYIWSCHCGAYIEVQREQMKDGAVFECPECKQVWGCVRGPHSYGSKWVPITQELADFHRLLPRHKPEDEDDAV